VGHPGWRAGIFPSRWEDSSGTFLFIGSWFFFRLLPVPSRFWINSVDAPSLLSRSVYRSCVALLVWDTLGCESATEYRGVLAWRRADGSYGNVRVHTRLCSRLVHHVTILTRQKKAVANTPNITTTLISTPKPRSEREVGLSTVRYIGILCNRTPFAVRGGDFAFRISYGDDYVQKVEWVWVVGFSD
jgi:hypothetical protein